MYRRKAWVEARGTVTLYEPRGDYQVNLAELRQAGLGALFEAFEKLKARLAIEGLFDNRHKKPLPAHPRAIGIVTSPRAAALRDVVTTLRRRAPGIPLILYPAQVQGEAAPAQIVAAIEAAGARQEVDVLIVCRGGGSIEDLWSFNDERVARAVFACPLPVVSGVGHETDFTICDFVADLRAPTPTAAAELTSPDRAAMLARLAELRRHLDHALRRRLENAAQRLDQLGRRLVHPGARLNQQRERLAADGRLLEQLIRSRLASTRQRVDGLGERLRRASPDLPRRAERLARDAAALTRARNGLLDTHRQRLARLPTSWQP
nr:exodeoxyribonuclease VII large subunit [Microvirgula aerodenitrificans]